MAQIGTPATHTTIHELAIALELDRAAYRRAVALASLTPGKKDWLRYLDRFLIAVGALLVLAGITAFFAFNWADMHRLTKFGLLEAGIVASVLLAWRCTLATVHGHAFLFAAAFLVGVLLAVFGQVYQTGADPYGLFLAWAILILPFAVIGRQAGLWLLLQVLLNLALILYWSQVLYPPEGWWQLPQLMGPVGWIGLAVMDWRLAGWLFALNAAAIALWEIAALRAAPWLSNRWFPRIIALLALYTVLGPTVLLIFAASAEGSFDVSVVSPVLFAVAMAACLWYYQYEKLDLFMLTAALFGAILVIMALYIRYVLEIVPSLLLSAVLLIAQVAGAARWLKALAQRRAAGS